MFTSLTYLHLVVEDEIVTSDVRYDRVLDEVDVVPGIGERTRGEIGLGLRDC